MKRKSQLIVSLRNSDGRHPTKKNPIIIGESLIMVKTKLKGVCGTNCITN